MFLDEFKTFTLKQKVTLIVITTIDLTSFCSISLLSLFLPKELASRAEYLQVCGVNVRFSAFMHLISSLAFGVILPKFGAKNVFLGAVVFSRISTTLFGTLLYIKNDTVYLCLAYLLKGLEALGSCAYFIAGYAIVFSIFPEELGIIRGLLETVAGIGTTIGPAVGELLFTNSGSGLPFFVVGATILVLAIGGSTLLEEVEDSNYNYRSFLSFLKLPVVLMTSWLILTVSMTISCIEPTAGDYFTQTKSIFSQRGYVYLVISIAFALSSPIWGYISEKEASYVWMMPAGLYMSAASLICLDPILLYKPIHDSVFFKLFVLCLLGVAMAMALVPTFRCLTLGALDQGFQNTLTTHSYVCSTWSFMFSIGEALGPVLGTVLINNYNFAITSAAVAGVNIAVASFYCLFLYNESKQRSLCGTFNFTIYFQ